MEYIETPESRITDLVKDFVVSAACAKRGRLNVDTADGIATRLRAASADMVVQSDATLLRTAAEKLERLSTKVKAQAESQRPQVAPEPTQSELSEAWDRMKMSGFDW
jgi:hypothetical protein